MKSKVNTKSKKAFSEGDAVVVQKKPLLSPQFKNLLAKASVGTLGIAGSMQVMKNLGSYGVHDFKSLSVFLANALKGKKSTGNWGKVLSAVSRSVIDAVEWANKMITPIARKVPDFLQAFISKEKFNEPISSTMHWKFSWSEKWFVKVPEYSKYTYGSCICMAFVASAVLLVLYKVIKSIFSAVEPFDVKENKQSYTRVFNKLSKLTEATDLSGVYSMAESFILKMKDKAVELYKILFTGPQVVPAAISAIASVCLMCVGAWIGMRVYIDAHPELNVKSIFDKPQLNPTLESVLSLYGI